MKRHYFSIDGSDEMMLLSSGGYIPRGYRRCESVCRLLSCRRAGARVHHSRSLQGGLSFLAEGKALLCITRTRAFGHPRVSRLLHRYPLLSHSSEFSLVLLESGFLIALIAPRPVLWMMLAAGARLSFVVRLGYGPQHFPVGLCCRLSMCDLRQSGDSFHRQGPLDGYLTIALSLLFISAVVLAGRHASRNAEAKRYLRSHRHNRRLLAVSCLHASTNSGGSGFSPSSNSFERSALSIREQCDRPLLAADRGGSAYARLRMLIQVRSDLLPILNSLQLRSRIPHDRR